MAQQVILVSDVPGLGQLGEVRKVKDGFARNYLIPNKLAVFATADAVKRFDKQKEKITAKRDQALADSKATAEKIAKVGLVFERPIGQGGRLFGSVTSHDITAELAKQNIQVEKKSVLMSGALKTAGNHVIRVRIHSQVSVDVPVNVVGLQTNKGQESSSTEMSEEERAQFAKADYDD